MARDQGHSDLETIYDTMLPQGVSTNQSLDSYVNGAASKQNLSSGFSTKWYSNQPAKRKMLTYGLLLFHLSPNVENKTVARQDLTKESKDLTN